MTAKKNVKPQHWKRLGHVFVAEKQNGYCFSHASYPVAVPNFAGRNAEHLRIIFSPRDEDNRSCIMYLDIELEGEKFEIKHIENNPILLPGARGAFDDAGVTIASIMPLPKGAGYRLYYLGWSLATSVPFRNFIGCADLKSWDGQAERVQNTPILDRSAEDQFTLGYPHVLWDKGQYHMWYGTHLQWGTESRLSMHHVLRHAISDDGLSWIRDKEPCLMPCDGLGDGEDGGEFALSRPWVIKDKNGQYHMWYARRFAKYKPGYAISHDGQSWERHDDMLHFSESSDWDNEAITYMSLFTHQGRLYMLYNGNGYGQTGFGLAVLEGAF